MKAGKWMAGLLMLLLFFLCPRSQSGSRRGQRYLVGTGTDGSPAGKPMAGTPVFC